MRKRIFEMMACAAMLTAACVSSNAQVQDRINRGCGGLGGILNQVITDFSGNIFMTPCLNKQVFICNTLGVCTAITVGGPSGSGTAGTIPLWTTSTNLGNSILTQTGTAAVTLGAGSFIYTQVAAPSLSAANFGKLYFDSTSKTLKGSYNAGAYLDFARANVTNGFLPFANSTGNTFGNSFAAQTGNNFTLTTPAAGVITLQNTGPTDFLILNGTTGAGLLTGSVSMTTRGGTGAYFQATAATNRVTMGDANGITNGAFVEVDQTAETFRVAGSASLVSTIESDSTIGLPAGAAQVRTLSGTGVTSVGDVAGAGSGTLFSIDDANRTITTSGGAALFLAGAADTGLNTGSGGRTSVGDFNGAGNNTFFMVGDGAQTFTLSNANYFNCVTLGTNGSGVITCTVSDVGLKNNLSPFTRGLWAINQLKPSYWTFDQGRYYHEGQRFAGLLAQDVQKVIPEAVTATGDGHLQINPVTIQATMVNAIKELSRRVERLEQENLRLRRLNHRRN